MQLCIHAHGIDNIIFISIATSKLPKEQQRKARLLGLGLAMGFRILLLCFIATIASWVKPIFYLDALIPSAWLNALGDASEVNAVSVRDLILFCGGLFLIYQSVREIHQKNYVYFAMAFSLGVELLNLRINKKRPEVMQR